MLFKVLKEAAKDKTNTADDLETINGALKRGLLILGWQIIFLLLLKLERN